MGQHRAPISGGCSISLTVTSGNPGDPFSIIITGFSDTPCATAVTFRWDPSASNVFLASEPQPVTDGNQYGPFTVPPGAAPGPHTVEASCTPQPGQGAIQTADATFTVNSPVTTTTTTTTTTIPGRGTTTTTTQPHKGSSTTTTTSSTTTTTTTTTTVPAPGTPPPTSNQALRLDRVAIPPGGPVTAAGYGCNPSSAVVLTVGTNQVGQTQSLADGTFSTPLDVGGLAVGRYLVVAHCGPALAASLDVVLASQVGQDTATLAIIVFFLLLGLVMFRRRIQLDTVPRGTARSTTTPTTRRCNRQPSRTSAPTCVVGEASEGSDVIEVSSGGGTEGALARPLRRRARRPRWGINWPPSRLAVAVAATWSDPAGASGAVASQATINGVAVAHSSGQHPVPLDPQRPGVVTLRITNAGGSFTTIHTVRIEGKVVGLTFFSYDTSVNLGVSGGSSTGLRFVLDLSGLGGQATGLIPGSVQLLDAQHQVVASQSMVTDVHGSLVSVYGLFGLALLILTVLAIVDVFLAMARHRLPQNRWRRALRFMTPGIGIGLVLVFTLSALRVWVPSPGTWLTMIVDLRRRLLRHRLLVSDAGRRGGGRGRRR